MPARDDGRVIVVGVETKLGRVGPWVPAIARFGGRWG